MQRKAQERGCFVTEAAVKPPLKTSWYATAVRFLSCSAAMYFRRDIDKILPKQYPQKSKTKKKFLGEDVFNNYCDYNHEKSIQIRNADSKSGTFDILTTMVISKSLARACTLVSGYLNVCVQGMKTRSKVK